MPLKGDQNEYSRKHDIKKYSQDLALLVTQLSHEIGERRLRAVIMGDGCFPATQTDITLNRKQRSANEGRVQRGSLPLFTTDVPLGAFEEDCTTY
jgi:hypothetical protein